MYFSKYHAKKTTVNGITFDSKSESMRYRELQMLERAGEIKDLQLQVPFELIPGEMGADGKKLRAIKYVADFVYTDCRTGKQVVEDKKGFRTPEYKLKKRLMWHIHGIDIYET